MVEVDCLFLGVVRPRLGQAAELVVDATGEARGQVNALAALVPATLGLVGGDGSAPKETLGEGVDVMRLVLHGDAPFRAMSYSSVQPRRSSVAW